MIQGLPHSFLPVFIDHNHCHDIQFAIAQQAVDQDFSLDFRNLAKLKLAICNHRRSSLAVYETLKTGTFNLIIAFDHMNEELDRTLNYLNECGNAAFSFHAFELHRYQADFDEMLVPSIHGRLPQAKHEDRSQWRVWNESD
ncbi:MAG TPA: hypothetical protein P5034_04535 [Rectinema sp.]|nr:hypothetical protein [Rectinema sp.]HRC83772.1 hypothetical protein [Rectinema sp.]HRR38145.1 hypothetical protein [Rectinema sp.]HRT39137.1 hypothetical protein [Rectinema sp.]